MILEEASGEVIETVPKRGPCSLLVECSIGIGTYKDYELLCPYHYRSGHPRAVRAVYRAAHGNEVIGVIVYAAPPLNSAIRNAVMRGRFRPVSTLGKAAVAGAINREIDLISRVIVHPTFRGIGLGARLIADTLRQRPFRWVEMSAAMGAINPFAQKAGMMAYQTETGDSTRRALSALRGCGIHPTEIANPGALARRIDSMGASQRQHIERQLLAYQKTWQQGRAQRSFTPDLRQAIAILSANALLTPVYYLWENVVAADPSRV